MSGRGREGKSSRRCGARTRNGGECTAAPVIGKRRCRMHGGAAGSGAPRGNKNALKTGCYTREMLEMRRKLANLKREARATLKQLGELNVEA